MDKKSLFVALLFAATTSVSAQKLSGDLSPLKGQKEVNVVINFSGMLVNNQPEESHIEFFTKNKTEEEKEQFLSDWNVKMREDAYVKLVAEVNKTVAQKGFSVGDFPNAKYTIYVQVININPGTPMVTNSIMKADVNFVKTGETAPFASLKYNKFIGRNTSWVSNTVARIAMLFGYLGENIGKTTSKNLK